MNEKLLITGGTGMVGSAIKKLNIDAICVGSNDFDLRSEEQTNSLFSLYNPKYVIHLAAKVGGIKANTDFVADFYTENIAINTNILNFSKKYGVKKLISILSTCVYPDVNYVKYPLSEDQLHLGPPHESNFGYAYAKRMLDVQSRAFNKQYGTKFICAIPNNIFGENDLFDINYGHVIPSVIRKIWEAKLNNKNVILWGDGSALREFTYSLDIARALLFLINIDTPINSPINIGNTKEYSIKNIAEKIANLLDFGGKIIWDTLKPSGQYRKSSSNEKFLNLGFEKKLYTEIDVGLKNTCDWFKKNYPNIRGIK